MGRISLCGVEIDNVTKEAAVARAVRGEETCVVFTPNAVMLEACRKDQNAQKLLSYASLALPDGAGVMMAAKRMGQPLRERVAGIEFGEALIEQAARLGLRVFLLGGKEGVAARAAERLKARYPDLKIAGTHWGYFDKNGEENRYVLSRIRETRADVLLVCFGFPTQERWIVENRGALTSLCTVAGLGGSLDVWAGKVKRAPRILSGMGLEWAWRMLQEPRRLEDLGALVRFAIFS